MKEIGNARRYKILAEGETFITIQDVEDKDKRVLKVPIENVQEKVLVVLEDRDRVSKPLERWAYLVGKCKQEDINGVF
jgi:hypothetical protein